MTNTHFPAPVELTDAELDAVAAGALIGNVGLINVGDVAVDVDLRDINILNNNDVAANVAVAVLSAVGQRANA